MMSAAERDSRILRGMERQLAVRRDRLAAGEKPLGWKVGFGAPAAMSRLQIDTPLVGFLTNRSLLPSEGRASVAGWTRPLAEPEIALTIGRDLTGEEDRAAARAAVAAVGPAIELADVDFPPDDVAAILAGNIYHRHVVLGRQDDSLAGCRLDGLVGQVWHRGQSIAKTADLEALTGDLVEIVRQVAGLLAALGERLHAGEIIIAGSIVPPIPIAPQEKIRYRLDPVDTIAIHLDG